MGWDGYPLGGKVFALLGGDEMDIFMLAVVGVIRGCTFV